MAESIEIRVPDIGDFEEVEVVELLVAKGDSVEIDDALVSIESDKATMEIPSSSAGTVEEVLVAEGDRVSEGSVLVKLAVGGAASESASSETSSETMSSTAAETETEEASKPDQPAEPVAAVTESEAPVVAPESNADTDSPRSTVPAPASRTVSAAAADPIPDREGVPHASPLVRRYARELGIPLETSTGTGPSGRVLVDDIKRQVRERFASDSSAPAATGTGIPRVPVVDFSAFGPVREEPLSRIQKVAGPGLHRSWLNVPHVTQHDESDVTELERFRAARREEAAERGLKLSPLLFVMKAVVVALNEFPKFRSSLAQEADRLIVKDYFHLGIAVDTEQGPCRARDSRRGSDEFCGF